MAVRLRFRLRTLIVAVAACSLLLAYVSSYHRLSRRGLRESVQYGIDGFFYHPFAEWMQTHDITKQRRLAALYWPINRIDRWVSWGKHPADNISWEISN
jgi:hypothetical protein